MKRFVCTLLACVCALSLLGACGSRSSEESSGEVAESVYKDGVHQYYYTQTEKNFIKNSATDYKIVIPTGAAETLQTAAGDLQMLFEEATGIRLAIYTDSDASAYADGKFISLGETTCMKNAGVTTEGKNLDKHGYIIKTVDDAIYICGGDENGTSFGVYGFLELEFGFDCFSNTCYYIDQGVTDKKLRAYDVTDIPDMKIRNNGDGYILKNKQTHRWMRYVERETGNTFCGASSAHTAMSYYLKYDTYSELYPEWYASKKQLCYTAKGNAEKLDRMQEEVFNLLKAEAIADTEGYLFVFSQEDSGVGSWCKCDACTASKSQYGSDAAVVVAFCNNVAERLQAWMETEEGKPYARDFKLLFLAYEDTLVAPTGIECNDRLSVMFAPIEMDYQNSLYHKQNKKFLDAFDGWKKVCKQFSIYSYHTCYSNFLMPYDSFNSLQEFYQYAASANTYWFFDLGQRNQSGGATGWETLKSYLSSKLAWNVNLDVEALTDKFFVQCYGAAAETMREYYNEYRVHSQYLIDEYLTANRSVYQAVNDARYFSKAQLDGWVAKIDQALKSIEHLQTSDLQNYNKIADRIKLERIWLYYAMCSLYYADYDRAYITQIKAEFESDCARIGVNYVNESSGQTIGQLCDGWTWGE